ncbi:MAG: DsbA family protein [Eggerthellaceae bacterium]|nr:DsbA family protein [Eggerthellaceae bacterium]
MEKKLVIEHFTDPLCFWCYAMEPEMRKIRVLLDDQLDYRIVMGVLSSDVHEIIGYDKDAELRYEVYRAMLANYFRESVKMVRMPLSLDNMLTHGPEDLVSLPLSLAYCAMKMIDKDIAEAYLRRMRERVFAEGCSLSTVDQQVQLASEFPIDVEQFRSNLDNPEIATVLQQGVDKCRIYGITAFPTLLLQWGDKRMMAQGYHTFEELKQAIGQVTGGDIILSDAEFSERALETYVDRFGKAAACEIQTMFSLNDAQLANAMMDLVGTGRYKTQSCGSSYFAMPR